MSENKVNVNDRLSIAKKIKENEAVLIGLSDRIKRLLSLAEENKRILVNKKQEFAIIAKAEQAKASEQDNKVISEVKEEAPQVVVKETVKEQAPTEAVKKEKKAPVSDVTFRPVVQEREKFRDITTGNAGYTHEKPGQKDDGFKKKAPVQLDKKKIDDRLDIVEYFFREPEFKQLVMDQLRRMGDFASRRLAHVVAYDISAVGREKRLRG